MSEILRFAQNDTKDCSTRVTAKTVPARITVRIVWLMWQKIGG